MIELAMAGGLAAACVVAGGVWNVASPMEQRRRHERTVTQKCREEKTLCLTYDDGPGAELTPRLLEILERREAHATFFMLGRRAQASPETADRVVAAGHEIGCHSHDHLNAWKTLPGRAPRDVQRGYETLSRWLPDRCLFRPPYGKATARTRRVARRHGSTLAWWTIDSGDTWVSVPSVESVVARVQNAGGGVVLMHDFDRQTLDAPERASFVLDVTDALLNMASEIGMRTSTMGQLFETMGQSVR